MPIPLLCLHVSKLLFWGSVMLIVVILSLFVAVLLQQKKSRRHIYG